jgi:hypothetical protein
MQIQKGDWQPCALCLSGAVPQCTEDFMSCTGFSDEKAAIASAETSETESGDEKAIVVTKEKIEKEVKGVARTVLEKHFKPLEEKRLAALKAKKDQAEEKKTEAKDLKDLKDAKCSDVDRQAFESVGAAAVAIDFGKCMEESCNAGDHKCVSKCVSDDTKLSPSCGQCFGDMAYCPQEQCTDACSSDPNASKMGCVMCMTEKCFYPFKECTGFSLFQAKALTHELSAVDVKKRSKLGAMFAKFEEAKKNGDKHHGFEQVATWYSRDCETLKKKRAFFSEQLDLEEDKRWKKMSAEIIKKKLQWFDGQIAKKCASGEKKSADDTEVTYFV